MIITVSGPPGAGTTTVALLLASHLRYKLVSAGEIFRKLAIERGMSLSELGKLALRDHSIDQALDARLIEIAKAGNNIVLEGRLTGAMAVRHGLRAFKVWINAPLDVRAKRVARREHKPTDVVMREIQEREKCENERYLRIYGVVPSSAAIYDMVIDSSHLLPQEIVNKIVERIGDAALP